MLNNDLLPIAIDLKVTIDMIHLSVKADTNADTPVILHTDGKTASFIISDYFTDMPPVDVKTLFHTTAGKTERIQDFWIRLDLTANEFYEKLKAKDTSTSDGVYFLQFEETVYVDVVLHLATGLSVFIQTSESTIYEGNH